MTASVTFQEKRATEGQTRVGVGSDPTPTPVILIPKRTVSDLDGSPVVWIVTGTTAARRQVTLGRDRLDQVEVRSGVAPGDTLILNPPVGLTDRGPVRPKGK